LSARPSQRSGRASAASDSPATDYTTSRSRPALVEDAQRLVDGARAQESEPGVDREDVEAVMGDGAGGDGADDVLARSADPSVEALVDVAGKRVGPQAAEQLVADPVGRDHPCVERVGDAVWRPRSR
jgi:hypothetical protein